MTFKNIFNKKQLPNWSIVLKLIGSYAVLSICFYGYVGIIDPKGSVYAPLLAKYSLIDAILIALIYPCIGILEVLGFATQHSKNVVGLVDGVIVRIAFPCLGIKIMIAYTALLFAFPGRKKMVFWILGILAVHVLNIIRITAIIIGYNHDRGIVHLTHDLFNYFGYACVCLLFYYWYTKQGDFQSLQEKG